MAHSSENTGNAFSMDQPVPRVSNETLTNVGSDNSSLTEGDLAILNRLQYLAEKVELLERKLDDTLHNVKGGLDSDLAESFAQDYSVINSFQVNVLTGPSCTQNDPVLADEGELGGYSSVLTRETWENAETEQTTSFLIIPVGNTDKGHEVCTLQSEQTLLAPETDLALPECITCDQGKTSMIEPTVGADIHHTSTTSQLPTEWSTLPISANHSRKVFSERLNETMFSTASIELGNCLPSSSTHHHEQQTVVSNSVSADGPGRSVPGENLNVSSLMMSGSSALSPPTIEGIHSLTYGYTIGLATANAQTDHTASLADHRQQPGKTKLMVRDDQEREITSRSVVEFTPNSNRKFQYCVARTEISGSEAISEAEGHDPLSEVNLDKYVEKRRLADESIYNSGLELSKQHHEDQDLIDSSNVEKPGLLDENQNYIQVSSQDVVPAMPSDREEEEHVMFVGQRDAISVNEVYGIKGSEGSITNRYDHYKRSQSNYDLKRIEMQMRYSPVQRAGVTRHAPGTQHQAANYSTNNERVEKFENNQRMPAVYSGTHSSVLNSEESRMFEASICSGTDTAKYRDTSPYRRNRKATTMQVNGGGKILEEAVDMTRKLPPVTSRGAPASKGSRSPGERWGESAAHEQSFEKHLRELIDPKAIGPAPVPEKPLRPLLAHSALAWSKESVKQLSFERDTQVLKNQTVARCSPLTEKERSYASYQSCPTHTMTGRADSSSDSPYSSLTSVSSALDLGGHSAENSGFSLEYDYPPRSATSPRNGRHDERASNSPSVSYISTDFSSATESGDTFCGFKLSQLSHLDQRVPAPLNCGDLIRNNAAGDTLCQLSSPTSSLDTSELSMIADSITECQCQYECECQTGIPSKEDFIEELKAISKYVLNARQNASTASKTHAQYFLDEEQGEMDILDAHHRENNRIAVPILVKVILRLRKHFFGTVDSKTPAPAPKSPPASPSPSPSPPKTSMEDASNKQKRKITFSPSAVLLSAIGDNSASEAKEVIEKERLDVNQLSPSGRSLLHKASASGDLESIHTLVEHGAWLNILDQDGFPPLHSALRKAHYKCAIFLMECGANLNSYTAGRVQEFLDVTELARIYLGNRDHDHDQDQDQVPFLGTMLNTAL